MKLQKFALILVLFSTLNIAVAQTSYCGTEDNPCTSDTWGNFDYTNSKADIKKIPPQQIDINRIVQYNRVKELTDEQIRQKWYELVQTGGSRKLVAKQIQNNFDYIDDLSKLDKNEAKKAIMSKYGVHVVVNGASKISNNVLMSPISSLTVSTPIYKKGIVFVEEDGRIEFIAHNIEMKDIPQSDKFYFQGTNNKFENGAVFSGIIKVEQGKYFMYSNRKLLIDGVEITSLAIYPNRIYLDGEDHSNEEKDFVSIDSNKRKAVFRADQNTLRLLFKTDNKILDVEASDYLYIYLSDSKLDIIRRDINDIIPAINAQHLTKDSKIFLRNDEINLEFEPYKLSHEITASLKSTSVPMEITQINPDGTIGFGKNEPKRLVISNFNEYAFFKPGQTIGVTNLLANNIASGTISTRLSYNAPGFTYFGDIKGNVDFIGFKEDLEGHNPIPIYIYKTPRGVQIPIQGEIEPIVLKRIVDGLELLPEKVVDSIKSVNILDSESYFKKCGRGSAACAFPSGDTYYMKRTVAKFDTLYHEAGHTLTFLLDTPTSKQLEKIKDAWLQNHYYQDKSFKEWTDSIDKEKRDVHRTNEERINYASSILKNSFLGPADPRFLFHSYLITIQDVYSWLKPNSQYNDAASYIDTAWKSSDEFKKIQERGTFTKEWTLAAGDVYGKELSGKEKIAGSLPVTWADGTYEPRNGCVSAYGCNNHREDVSTYLEDLYTKPEKLASLINKNAGNYDERYDNKLKLLVKYGYVAPQKYAEIKAMSQKLATTKK